MNAPASITVTPVRVADLLAEGERMPVNVHIIDHPDARVPQGRSFLSALRR
jgi:N-acyl homoserine lactone hydrolase